MKPLAALLLLTLTTSTALAHDPVYGKSGMVVTQEPLAADVGVSVLKAGGNAVDAAVAVGFALAVTHPFAGNLGGGGFMLIRLADGRSTFIDFREAAPAKATHNMYLDAQGNPIKAPGSDQPASIDGWLASGVPGTVRGLALAHQRYGHTAWRTLLQPSVHLATDGFPVPKWQVDSWQHYAGTLSRYPESKRIFIDHGLNGNDGHPWHETFRQPELARTLTRIADHGAADFYDGQTAHLLADAEAKNGGLITLADLHNYRAIERKPLEGDYHGYHVITSPPPSSGGVGILQMLGILDTTGYGKGGPGAASTYHYEAEAMRRFYADRNTYLGDPDFPGTTAQTRNPIPQLLAPAYIAQRRSTIQPDHATPSDQVSPGLGPAAEETDTTHFSIVDAQGNAVAVTYTLNNGYGSGVTVPGAGFLLNDEMDDFAAKPGSPNMFGLVQGERNAIAPGKRPLSSMTPTILTRDGKPFLVLGAPGGSTITTAVLQVILNVVDFGMGIQDAIDFPRVHHQWKPDRLEYERGVSPDTLAALQHMGYILNPSHPVVLALVEAVEVKDGWLMGGHDDRGSGKAVGY